METETFPVSCTHCGTDTTVTRKQAGARSIVCHGCWQLFHFPYPLPCDAAVSWLQNTWLAICPCGWRGQLTRDQAAAEAEADQHNLA